MDKIMTWATVLMFFIIFISLLATVFLKEEYSYEYIDFDNNKGIAEYCSYEYIRDRAAAKGSPVCELKDGTVKLVKEYKAVKKEA